MTNNPSKMLHNCPWFDPSTDYRSSGAQISAKIPTVPSNCPKFQIKSANSFPQEKNLTECSTLRCTCLFKNISRQRDVENSSIAHLTKKIKKDNTITLKKKKKEKNKSFESKTIDNCSQRGYVRPERDLNRVIEANRKLYTTKNYLNHHLRGDLQVIKRLVLKSMGKIHKWMDPIQGVRLFDYEVRPDTTVLLDNIASRE
jgi:hypothetical protein